jgi:hypothetical protein
LRDRAFLLFSDLFGMDIGDGMFHAGCKPRHEG